MCLVMETVEKYKVFISTGSNNMSVVTRALRYNAAGGYFIYSYKRASGFLQGVEGVGGNLCYCQSSVAVQ